MPLTKGGKYSIFNETITMTITNDHSEANYFNKISDGDYNVLTESDYNIFLDIIQSEVICRIGYLDELEILEVCCGTGIFGRKILSKFKSKHIKVTGVDISKELIDYLRSLKLKNYIPINGNVLQETLFTSEIFDIIICPFALHHLLRFELEIFLKNVWKWLKPEGFIIAFEPNGSNAILWVSNKIGKIYRFIFNKTFHF